MKVDSNGPGVFESFNARTLAPEQVAKTFIPPIQFDEIVKRSHTLIIGPRGSGKTTLLKMLQLPALETWGHPKSSVYRKNIDYTGVFVPADTGWGAQLEALGGGRIPEEIHDQLGISAFTTHILIALVDAISARTNMDSQTELSVNPVRISVHEESALAEQIASGWQLDLELPSIRGLRLALRKRLLEIGAIASRIKAVDPAEAWAEVQSQDFLHISFLDAVSYGIDVFNSQVGDEHGRWALLFDELEIAPRAIRTTLIQSLRSVDQRILFKLSISPYSQDIGDLEAGLSAMPGQDYLPVTLWYSTKGAAYDFCRSLFRLMLREHGLSDVSPEKVFGRSEFDTDRSEWADTGTAYGPKSRLRNRFVALAGRDKSFSKYLDSHGVDPNSMHQLPRQKRERVVRKVTSIVAVRETFRGSDDVSAQGKVHVGRSRKRPGLYAGATSLFAITEGNPRWFIGIVSPLISQYAEIERKVSAGRQVQEIEKAAHRFRALLKTIPCTPVLAQGQTRGLLTVLDRVGEYFSDQIVRNDFSPEPVGTFIVDSNTDQALLEALGKALNAGAIVYVPDGANQDVIGLMRGKRFRLSYLLAPYYHLPPTVGRPRSLFRILSPKAEELDLFFEAKND